MLALVLEAAVRFIRNMASYNVRTVVGLFSLTIIVGHPTDKCMPSPPPTISARTKHNCVNVHAVALRMQNHAGPSGYDRLAPFLTQNIVRAQRAKNLSERILLKLLARYVEHSGSTWYSRESLLTELHLAKEWLRNDHQLFHFLYGENSFRYLTNLRRISKRKNWAVATFHTPAWKFHEKVQHQRHIEQLDGAIAVSTVQMPFLETLLPGRVHFVPHGVDTDFFQPSETPPRGPLNFIMVGSHLRDYDIAAQAIGVIGRKYPSTRFTIVTNPTEARRFDGFTNTEVLAGVSDEKLRELYQASHALLLPLTDSTANNSLLEAMACGLPVVSTDLVGVRDYIDHPAAVLTPRGELDALVEVLDNFCKFGVPDEMRDASRTQALKFDWARVAGRTQSIYAQIMSERV